MEAKLSRARGFTAYELLVVVGLAALLATLAVPGFGSLRRAAGLSAATNQLIWALHFARSSAVLRGVPAAVCLSADDHTCMNSAGSLATGWLVFHTESQHAMAQPVGAAPLLHSFRLPADVTVTGTRPVVTFWPVARAGTTGTFNLCDVSGRSPGRAVVVSQTGRPRVSAEAAACAS